MLASKGEHIITKQLDRKLTTEDRGADTKRISPTNSRTMALANKDCLTVQTVLALQNGVGNAAVAQFLANNKSSGSPRKPTRVLAAGSNRDFQTSGGEPPAAPEESTLDQQAGRDQQRDAAVVSVATQPAPPPNVAATPTVGFTTVIRGPSTPAAMARDRIPPSVDFPVAVTLTDWRMPMAAVVITVEGSGGANGTVTVNGGASAQIAAGGTVTLRGTAQTTPGNAGNLRLTARLGGRELASSNTFSVAAIPQDMVLASISPLTGNLRGFVVTQTWSSDSGNVADLDQVQVAELVQYITSLGCFSGLGAANSGYINANGGTLTDTHSTPVAALTSSGTRVANQTEMFLDRRTGVTDIPMRNSGFVITRLVVLAPPIRSIGTSKMGAAVTAKGVASAPGGGSFTLPQGF